MPDITTFGDDMPEVINSLIAYAEVEGSEWGEMLTVLIQLWGYRWMVHEDLIRVLEREIRDQLEYAKEEFEIVEEIETITRPVRFLRERENEDLN